jgi:hypothetical protein
MSMPLAPAISACSARTFPIATTRPQPLASSPRPGSFTFSGSERSNYQLFLAELCDLLDLDHPDPASPDNAENRYVFERAITRSQPDGSTSTVFADLYKKGCFILETKQGADAKDRMGSRGFRPVIPSDPQSQSRVSLPNPLPTA